MWTRESFLRWVELLFKYGVGRVYLCLWESILQKLIIILSSFQIHFYFLQQKSVVLSDDDDSSQSEGKEETIDPKLNLLSKRISDISEKKKKTKTRVKASVCPRKQELLNASSACSICWEKYRDGETVCLSSNKHCNHAYHFDCILPWLLKRNDCPLCRRNFLKG